MNKNLIKKDELLPILQSKIVGQKLVSITLEEAHFVFVFENGMQMRVVSEGLHAHTKQKEN